MFGQNDDNQNQPFQDINGMGPAPDNSTPPNNFYNPAAAPVQQQPVVTQPDNGVPAADNNSAPVLVDPNPTDFTAGSTPADGPAPIVDNTTAADSEPAGNNLLSMKQEALQHLTPLVNHLDQSPEEKFRTVMMMIQASDDQSKLNEAFEIAKQITDDKTRAQALLDVINEINYFTQQHNS